MEPPHTQGIPGTIEPPPTQVEPPHTQGIPPHTQGIPPHTQVEPLQGIPIEPPHTQGIPHIISHIHQTHHIHSLGSSANPCAVSDVAGFWWQL